MQVAHRHTPRLANRSLPAHQRQRLQVRQARPAQFAVECQPLPAPRGAVGTPSGAVQRDRCRKRTRRRKTPVLGKHRRGVRQMVLDRQNASPPFARELLPKPCAWVVGVRVHND